MIDTGVDDFCPEDETTVTVEAPYEQFGTIQKWLEDNGFEIVSGESLRVPTDTKELDAEVVAATKAAGFDNLKGHKSVGGLRASIYNAMPKEGVEALVEFLKNFEANYGK